MKARYLTLLATVVITLGMTFSLLFVARRIVLADFLELENRHMRQDLHRAVRHLNAELQNLDLTAKDYASWDETHRYMETHDARYLSSTFSEVSLENLKLRSVILLDEQGRVVAEIAFHKNGARKKLDSDIAVLKGAAGTLKASAGTPSGTGIIGLSDGPVLASMRPILTTREQGPSRGTLIMLRDLDYRLLGKITSLAEFPTRISRTAGNVTVNRGAVESGVHSYGDTSIRVINEDQLAVSTDLIDWFGNPAFELQISHDREVWRQGQHAYRFLMYSIVIFGCVFGVVVLVVVQLVYVNRVKTLVRFAEQIKNEQGLKSRINFRWKDELAKLADQINQMLEDLQNSHEKLALAHERLQHEATHDSLTGAWNCAAALELLDREIARSERERTHVAVLMFDIDHFKDVNDRFGHAAGDRALQAITASVGKILRTTDILARYGGEEFLVIAPDCSFDEARRLADRIVLRMQTTPLEVGEQKLIITLSIGLVSGSYPLSAEELIALADRALYRAKANGRNRAEFEEALPARVKGALYCMPRRSV